MVSNSAITERFTHPGGGGGIPGGNPIPPGGLNPGGGIPGIPGMPGGAKGIPLPGIPGGIPPTKGN
jgi:hypothetical protein